MKKFFLCAFIFFAFYVSSLLISCAAQRQGVVCDEIEYRLNSMAYSPDQRYYIEDELRACREEESKKKDIAKENRKSIYERFAASDSTQKVYTTADSIAVDSSTVKSPDVSEFLQDSTATENKSIYDRYSNKAIADTATSAAPDTTAVNPAEFQ